MTSVSTKEKILRAASGLLENSGIKAVTQPAVAALVGISQGQLTYHFPKRADLVLALTDFALDRVAELVWTGSADMTAQIWELLRTKNRVRALLGLLIEADDNVDVRTKLLHREQRSRLLIAKVLDLDALSNEVTVVHATLLGLGMISFLHAQDDAESDRNIKKAFVSAQKLFSEQYGAPKRRKKK
jgi:AcrR family transcriptional regulator